MTALPSGSAVDLGALVRPWQPALLAAHVRPEEDPRSPDEDPRVWLSWDFPREYQIDAFTRLVEAVQLYVLLEWADHDAWLSESRVIQSSMTHWRMPSWCRDTFEGPPPPRVSGSKLTLRSVEEVHLFSAFLFQEETVDHCFSPEYVRVRRALEAKLPPEASKHIPMYWRFSLGITEWKRVWELLPPILSLAVLQATPPSLNCRLLRSGARLDYVDFSPAFVAPTEASTLEQLLQMCRLGVVVPNLPEFNLTRTRANATLFVKTVKELLGSRCGGFAGNTRSVRLLVAQHEFAAIASATTDASGLDSVYAAFPDNTGNHSNDPTAKLQWIAYAFFSHASNPKTRKISLGCSNITLSHVAAMEALLLADDPLAVLYGEFSASILENRNTRLSASRIFLFDPTVEAEEYAALDDTLYHGLRVLGGVGEWWIVFFPGWGKAWVHARDAQVSAATEAQRAATRPGVKAIDHLDLVSARDLVATAALLRLVGNNVTRLVVQELTAVTEDWCAEIASHCTGLQELDISGITGNGLAAIVECATNNPVTKLERLFIDLQFIEEANLSELSAVFAALADRQHPISKQLRAFGFQAIGVVFGDTIRNTEIFTHAQTMLAENQALRHVFLGLPIIVTTYEQAMGIKSAFDRYRGQKLSIWANHIPVRDKAAFLSVLTGENSTGAMRELDRGVIANILDFAPKPRYRHVRFIRPEID